MKWYGWIGVIMLAPLAWGMLLTIQETFQDRMQRSLIITAIWVVSAVYLIGIAFN